MKSIQNSKFLIFALPLLFISCGENKNDQSVAEEKKETEKTILSYSNTSFLSSSEFVDNYIVKQEKFDKIIWSDNKNDLNGDGQIDEIKVFATDEFISSEEQSTYTIKVCINNSCADLNVNWGLKSYYGKDTEYEIIDIVKGDDMKELLIIHSEDAIEDPSKLNSIFRLYANGEVTVSNISSTGYSNGQIQFINDKEFTVDHMRFPDIKGTYTLGSKGIKQLKLYKQPEDEVDYSQMAACPYVYLIEDDKLEFKGEILRYLNVDYAEVWQKLSISSKSKISNKIRIVISEEKEEETYLNAVYLLVANKKISPKIISNKFELILKDDEKYLKLVKGDKIELEFDLPKNCSVNTFDLFGKGYYLPKKVIL
jgi:hypothetical protein